MCIVWMDTRALKTAPPVCRALAVCQRFTGLIALKPQQLYEVGTIIILSLQTRKPGVRD